MKQTVLIIACCLILLPGCSAFNKWNYGDSRSNSRPNLSKDEMWKQIRQLQDDNQKLRRQIDQVGKKKNEELETLTNRLKAENTKVTSEKRSMEQKLLSLEGEKKTLEAKLGDLDNVKDPSKIKIKVLGGDGDIKTALETSSLLKQMGYKIRLVGLASRPTFKANTVFYTKDYKAASDQLVKLLGKETVTKPLTWKSVYDIIVVTGKQSN